MNDSTCVLVVFIASFLSILVPSPLLFSHSSSIVAYHSSPLRSLLCRSARRSYSTMLLVTGGSRCTLVRSCRCSSAASSAPHSALLQSSLCPHRFYHLMSSARSGQRCPFFTSLSASPQRLSTLPPAVDGGTSSACFLAGIPEPKRQKGVLQHLSMWWVRRRGSSFTSHWVSS